MGDGGLGGDALIPPTMLRAYILIWSAELPLKKKKQAISYLKTSRAFKQSNPLMSSPGSPSQLVSDSVGITSSCWLLAFPISVSLTLLCLHCLCFSASHCARLLIVATPVLKAAKTDEIKSHGNNLRDVNIAHDTQTDRQTHRQNM